MKFDIDAYETVESRIKRFYSDHPKGTITTELLSDPNRLDTAVVKAYLYDDWGNTLLATGMAFEQIGQGPVNKTSHLENAETSAIGRCLANYNYSGDKRPSREEMEKTQGAETKPAKTNEFSDIDQLFQKITAYCKAHPDQFPEGIGQTMNKALQMRTSGEMDSLKALAEEIGA